MSILPNVSELTGIASALAPGMIILGFRSRVVVGVATDYKDRLLSYAFFSAAYYAGVGPLFHLAGCFTLPAWLWGFLFYFAMPLVMGFAAAYECQHEIIDKAARRLRFNFVTETELAWDFVFSKWDIGNFILITLEDGSQIAGRIDENSFASSSKSQHDLLIGEVWEITLGKWTEATPKRSILILSKDIRSVEFFKGDEDD